MYLWNSPADRTRPTLPHHILAEFQTLASSTTSIHPSRTWKAALIAGGLVIWALLLVLGLRTLKLYDTTPGQQQPAPMLWPATSTFSRGEGSWTLVMFVHPLCPCSRASLEEFSAIMDQTQGRPVRAYVDFLPLGASAGDVTQTHAWALAGQIAGATRFIDSGGKEARRFRALTSGYCVAYGPAGHLEFSGGITDARGEVGDNVGREAVLDLLAGRPAATSHHAVFGCALLDPTSSISENALEVKP